MAQFLQRAIHPLERPLLLHVRRAALIAFVAVAAALPARADTAAPLAAEAKALLADLHSQKSSIARNLSRAGAVDPALADRAAIFSTHLRRAAKAAPAADLACIYRGAGDEINARAADLQAAGTARAQLTALDGLAHVLTDIADIAAKTDATPVVDPAAPAQCKIAH